MKKVNIKKVIGQFILATNKFDVEAALTLFAKDAVIDDGARCVYCTAQ